MNLTLILGPMKSGKSYELISFFAPLKYSNIKFGLYQPTKDIRDAQVKSRNGSLLESNRIMNLKEILRHDVQVVGIDEFHMFEPSDAWVVEKLLKDNKTVFISSLDNDYRGVLFPVVARLFAMGPREVKFRRAVCEVCKIPDAVFTQIFDRDKPVLGSLPSVIPEDGRFRYAAVCRSCFVKEPLAQGERLL